MKISRDDLHKKTTGELSRLFNAAQADLRRHQPTSEASRRIRRVVEMIRDELAGRGPAL